jgi:aminoglycoside phosphotransferase (APT) family kinase protein
MWKPVKNIEVDHFRRITNDFYFVKSLKRIDEMHASRGIEDKADIINGVEIPSLKELISQIDFAALCNSEPTTFHGDFILDNIIYQGDEIFKLIDWRQDFGGEIEAGDQYYDLAKLAHNLVVNHEIIDNNQFKIEIGENGGVKVNIHRLQSLVDCENLFFNYIKVKGLDYNKVKLLRSIIWLNMSPLHHHPFDLFLYYFGKYSLFNQLNDMKNGF